MKYLFFDLECSNCYGGVGKVCEYGAVLTDDNLNIIKEISIPINPGKDGKFDMKIYDRDPGFDWAYNPDYYYNCPEFPKYYQIIKNLMEDKDTLVFGYSSENDIRYLYETCKRYNLEQIEYNVYDVQIIKKNFSKKKQQIRGLSGACLELCDFSEYLKLTPHLAKDDSKMTMMILREMCKYLEATVQDMIELCPKAIINSVEYIKEYQFRKEDKLLHPEKYIRHERVHVKNECQVVWGDFYREYDNQAIDEQSKTITISSKLKEDMSVLKTVIDTIKENNYIARDRITGSKYLVVLDEHDKLRMESVMKYPYDGKILLLNDFVNNKLEGVA